MSLIALDRSILIFFNRSFRCEFLDFLSILFADPRPFIPIIILILLYLFYRGGRNLRINILWLFLLILLSDQVSCHLLKPIFGRIRPCHSIALSTPLGCSRSYSFPSGHATNIMAFAIFVMLNNRKWGPGFLFLALVVSLSRLYLGVHYPSDILGGWLVGAGLAVLVNALKNKIGFASRSKKSG